MNYSATSNRASCFKPLLPVSIYTMLTGLTQCPQALGSGSSCRTIVYIKRTIVYIKKRDSKNECKKKHTNQIHVYNIPFPVFVQRKFKKFQYFLQEIIHIFMYINIHIKLHINLHIFIHIKSRKIKILLLLILLMLMLFYIFISSLTYSILLRIPLTVTVYVISAVC